MRKVSDSRKEELRIMWEKILKKYDKNEVLTKGFKKYVALSDGRAFIRCQRKLDSGKQCSQKHKSGSIYCNAHSNNVHKRKSKQLESAQKEIRDMMKRLKKLGKIN